MPDFNVCDLPFPLADVLDEIHLDEGVADLLDLAAGFADFWCRDLLFGGQQGLLPGPGLIHLC